MSEYRFFKSFNSKLKSKVVSAKSARTSNYGNSWSTISAKCLELANYTCRDCGKKANRAHHIIPLSKGGSNAQFNLKAVCESCHSKYHGHLRKSRA